MGDNFRIGIFPARPLDAVPRVFHVDVAASLPEIHRASRLFDDPGPKVLIRHKEDRTINRSRLHDPDGIPAGADDIGKCLHSGTAIDVGNDEVVF